MREIPHSSSLLSVPSFTRLPCSRR
uniref:Uncharacterized protein n=1 Tax=Arundo donax TaxID=35708 RepID=A0A0A8YQR5_ARUDO